MPNATTTNDMYHVVYLEYLTYFLAFLTTEYTTTRAPDQLDVMSSDTGRPPPLPPRTSTSRVNPEPKFAPPLPPRQVTQSTMPTIPADEVVIVDADGNAIPTTLNPPAVNPDSASATATPGANKPHADSKSVISLKTIAPASTTEDPKNWLSPSSWLHLVSELGKEETEDVKVLRKQVEQEEIKRYMTNFNKVIDPSLRFAPPSTLVWIMRRLTRFFPTS